ncbi:NAD(P)H-dependent oxidoreductase [Thioflavicoccus mobilis]|nr:NAD(P)H-dependent oxidoreductase [Thioflavicoccus mobilis]
MKCLIVKAHPLKDSLCTALTQHVVTVLTNAGRELTVEDLYEDKFEPALTAKERRPYYAETYDSSDVAAQVERLREAEALVLIFPTWWLGFPAMLKGRLDRVWAPGITYDHASNFEPIEPQLDNLRKVLLITTLGASWRADRVIMRQPLKRTIKFALLGAYARDSRFKYLSLYNSEKLDEGKIEKTLRKWM